MKLPSILGTRGARDKPKDSYGGSAYSFFFGRSTSGKNVNERTAMQTMAGDAHEPSADLGQCLCADHP